MISTRISNVGSKIQAKVWGWGSQTARCRDEETFQKSDRLKVLDVRLLDCETCEDIYKDRILSEFTISEICAGPLVEGENISKVSTFM